MTPQARLVLLAGPSGSGKTHLAEESGLPLLDLDDFYKNGDDPSVPRHPTLGIVDWDEVPGLFTTTEMAAEAARLRGLHASDVAAAVRSLPLAQRRQLAEMMEDDRLADLLEEKIAILEANRPLGRQRLRP